MIMNDGFYYKELLFCWLVIVGLRIKRFGLSMLFCVWDAYMSRWGNCELQ